MTRREEQERIDEIAREHGCEIGRGAFGETVISVIRKWQGQGMSNDEMTSACKADLIRAGIRGADRWLT